jgi:hypothetical protein
MIYPKKYTAAEWAEKNITLKNGEVGIEKDTKRRKMGTGYKRWNELPYEFDRAAADARYRKEIDDLKTAVASGGGPVLTHDEEDPGTFIINNPVAFQEDPADPGTYLIGV